MTKHAKGAAAAMLSAVCFGLMPLLTKMIYAQDSEPITVVFLRFLIVSPVIFLCLKRWGVPLKITLSEFKRIAILAILGYGGTAILYFAAFSRIPAGLTVTLHFIYPVLVIVAGVIFLRQKPTWIMVASVALCIAGIALLSGGASDADPLGMVLAVASGVTYAFYIVYLHHSGLGTMHTLKLILYMNLMAAVLMLVASAFNGGLHLPATARGWGLTVALSLMVSLVAVQLFQIGVRAIGPQRSAILSTFEPLTGVLAGVIFYREPFTGITAVGSVLVLAAVVLTTLEKPSEKKE